jgi:hypothetical protein
MSEMLRDDSCDFVDRFYVFSRTIHEITPKGTKGTLSLLLFLEGSTTGEKEIRVECDSGEGCNTELDSGIYWGR